MAASLTDTSLSSPPDSLSSVCTVDEPLAGLLEFSALASSLERPFNTEVHGPYGIEPLRKIWSRNDTDSFERLGGYKERPTEDYLSKVPPRLLSVTRGRDLSPFPERYHSGTKPSFNKTAPFHSVAFPVYYLYAVQKHQAHAFDAVYDHLGPVLHRGTLLRAQWALANEQPVMSIMYLYGQRYRNNRPVLDHQAVAPSTIPSEVFVLQEGKQKLNDRHVIPESGELRLMQNQLIGLQSPSPLIFTSGSSGYSTSPSFQTPRFSKTLNEVVEGPRDGTIDSNQVAEMFRDFYGNSESLSLSSVFGEQSGSTVTILGATSDEEHSRKRMTQFQMSPFVDVVPSKDETALGGLMLPTTKTLLQLAPGFHHRRPLVNRLEYRRPYWSDDMRGLKASGDTPVFYKTVKRWDAPYSETTSPHVVTPHFEVEEEFVDFNQLCVSKSGSLLLPFNERPEPLNTRQAQKRLLDGLKLGDAPLVSTQIGGAELSNQTSDQSTDLQNQPRPPHNAFKQLDSHLYKEDYVSTITSPTSFISETLSRDGTQVHTEIDVSSNVSTYCLIPTTTPDTLQSIRAIAVESQVDVATNERIIGPISPSEKTSDLFTMPMFQNESDSSNTSGNVYPAMMDFSTARSLSSAFDLGSFEVTASSIIGSISSPAGLGSSEWAASFYDTSTTGSTFGNDERLTSYSADSQMVQHIPNSYSRPVYSGSHDMTTEIIPLSVHNSMSKNSHVVSSVSDVFHTITLDDSLRRDEDESEEVIFSYKPKPTLGLSSSPEEDNGDDRKSGYFPGIVTYLIFRLFPMWISYLSCRSRHVRDRETSEISARTSEEDPHSFYGTTTTESI